MSSLTCNLLYPFEINFSRSWLWFTLTRCSKKWISYRWCDTLEVQKLERNCGCICGDKTILAPAPWDSNPVPLVCLMGPGCHSTPGTLFSKDPLGRFYSHCTSHYDYNLSQILRDRVSSSEESHWIFWAPRVYQICLWYLTSLLWLITNVMSPFIFRKTKYNLCLSPLSWFLIIETQWQRIETFCGSLYVFCPDTTTTLFSLHDHVPLLLETEFSEVWSVSCLPLFPTAWAW